MTMLQVEIGVVIGLAWFTAGAIFPVVSCSLNKKFEVDDFYMIPVCGVLGVIALVPMLFFYVRTKKRLGRN